MSANEVPITRLHELFEVREDGALIRKVARPGRSWLGSVAGSRNSDGYVLVMVDRVNLKAHRVVWAMTAGAWPKEQIDHINGIRDDNRPCNLREATIQQNMQNKRGTPTSATGLLGAYPHGRRFIAKATVAGKRITLGYFDTAEEAHTAYLSDRNRRIGGGVL